MYVAGGAITIEENENPCPRDRLPCGNVFARFIGTGDCDRLAKRVIFVNFFRAIKID